MHRDRSGAYLRDEWTSWSDIGETFSGETLTLERYLATEEAYLASASAFLSEANIQSLRVTSLENRGGQPCGLVEGSTIQATDLHDIVRALLREEYWCKLHGTASFLHVGYDYYMYVGVPIECPRSSALAQSLGLFVEAFRSPYA